MAYVGQLLDLPGGMGTLTSDNNAARGKYTDLIVAEGIVSERGVWEREPGATPYTAGASGIGIDEASFAMTARANGAAAVYTSFLLTGDFSYDGTLASFFTVTPTVTISGTVLSGQAILVSLTCFASTGPTSVTDSAGNTYIKAGEASFGSGANQGTVQLWYVLDALPMSTGQLIMVNGAPASCVGNVGVASGLRALDQTNTSIAGAGATSTTQPAAFTPAEQHEVMIIAYGDLSNGASVTPLPVATFTRQSAFSFGVASQLYTGLFPFVASVGINALSDYWVNAVTQRLLAMGSDGFLYKSSGGGFTRLSMATQMDDDASIIVIGGQENAASAGRKAFLFDNGNTKIQTLTGDGVATTNFGNNWNTTTNIPADWAVNPPRAGLIHKERLWAWAPANAPHNLYASSITDHENFKNAVGGTFEYVQAIGTGTGVRIAAAASFKGMLFVFKYPRGVYFLDDSDVDYLNWRWSLVTDAVGVADSPHSVIVLDDDILMVAPDGHLHFLSAITQQGVRSSDLTASYNLQNWTRANINVNRLGRMSSSWYPGKKLAMLGMSSFASVTNDLRLFLDFSNANDQQVVRISYSHRDDNRALAVRRVGATDGTQRPIFGDSDGIVWLMDQENKQKVGVPNVGQARYQYNPGDFSDIDTSLANKRKLFDALTVVFNPTGNWNLGVDSIIDGRYQETLLFNMGGVASILGTFRFGERLGGGTITTSRHRMTGNGYWLSLAGWVSGEGHDFSVARHFVNFRIGGEEQR